jgi:hypothetical protein
LRMGVLRIGITACTAVAIALGEGFSFTLGNPVAAQDYRAKTASFVFRAEGCADPAKAQITGTAEGLVNGVRHSVPLKVSAMAKPGIYAVYQTWLAAEGAWVVNLKGACGAENAGALVPTTTKGFLRDSVKFFPRPATDVEIETALKKLAQGANR